MGGGAVKDTIWPAHTERGEYDSDYGRIVCADCDWYDVGGSVQCSWTYYDHRMECHPERTS